MRDLAFDELLLVSGGDQAVVSSGTPDDSGGGGGGGNAVSSFISYQPAGCGLAVLGVVVGGALAETGLGLAAFGIAVAAVPFACHP